jgi:hypothetical protein
MENSAMDSKETDFIADSRKDWKAPAIRELEINKDTYFGGGGTGDLLEPATS